MLALNQWRLIGLLSPLLLFAVVSNRGFASPNATIVNGDVNLRSTYPTYSVSTLFKFQLAAGDSLVIIPKGTRVEVSAKKIVERQEWFETTYASRKGWVYAGDVGTRRYVQLDPGVEKNLRVADRSFEFKPPIINSGVFLLGDVYAQSPQSAVVEPVVSTNPLRTLLVPLVYVVVFIGSMVAIKRWVFPGSDKYTFLTSLGVLLILGVISETVWADMIGKLVATGGAL